MSRKVDAATIDDVTTGEFEQKLTQYALKEMAVNVAVSYIAAAISKCTFKVYKNGEQVKDKPFYKLNVSPHPNHNRSAF